MAAQNQSKPVMTIRAHLLLVILIASVAGLALGSFQMFEGKRRANLERGLGRAGEYIGRLDLTTDSLKTFLITCDLYFWSDQPLLLPGAKEQLGSLKGSFRQLINTSFSDELHQQTRDFALELLEFDALLAPENTNQNQAVLDAFEELSGRLVKKTALLHQRADYDHGFILRDASAAGENSAAIFGLSVILFCVTSFALVNWSLRSIAHPLSVLAAEARNAISSRKAFSVDTQGTLEAIELTTTINEFAASLERLVAERTLQLEQRSSELEELAASLREEISNRAAIQKELITARDLAEDANRAKSNFLAVMSHEIRTPMNAVMGFTNLLLETELSSQQRDFSQTILVSAENLLTLINDILDFSKVESGKMELETEPFVLRQSIEGAMDIAAGAAARKSLELFWDASPDLPRAFNGDMTRLRQVLINLLGNAVKFTQEGEVSITATGTRLRATTEEQADRWEICFTVRDTGIGMSPEQLERLFLPFTQGDSSISRKYGGTGLGLAISKRLVEMMHGEFTVLSEIGQGTQFSFTVQMSETHLTEDEIPAEAGDWGNRRVLVVDDSTASGDTLCRLVQRWGIRAAQVNNLEAARRAVATERPDLILLDSTFANPDGAEFVSTIRKESPPIRVVHLATLGHESHLKETYLLTQNAWQLKPIHHSALYNLLADEFAQEQLKSAKTATKFVQADAIETNRRILIAEDNMTNQKLARLTLAKLGYTPDIVSNGKEAVEACDGQGYDIVLMDLQMPEMDGITATRLIREHEAADPQRKRTRIIAMTANAMTSDRDRCIDAGMDDFISKPVKIDALTSALDFGSS
jgi:signal transduction histidine kinase/DNA-binding response OmpR family regulator